MPLFDGLVQTVTIDPRVLGVDAAIGAIIRNTVDNTYFQKISTSPTDWLKLGVDTFLVTGAPATAMTFNIDGDDDGGVLIDFYLVSAKNATWVVLPNGVDDGTHTSRFSYDAGGMQTAYGTNPFPIAFTGTGYKLHGSIVIPTKSGQERTSRANAAGNTGGAQQSYVYTAGTHATAATVYMSLVVTASTGASSYAALSEALDVGSWASLVRLGRPHM